MSIEKTTITLTSIFRQRLKKLDNHIFHYIFQALPDDVLESTLRFIYEIYTGQHPDLYQKEDWFYCFHKGLRQGDTFMNVFTIVTTDQRTEEEKKEQEKLFTDLYFECEHANPRPKSRHTYWREKFPKEYARWQTLIGKKTHEERESFNGQMDMILWEAIHLDTKSVLNECMKKTFKEYFIETPSQGDPALAKA